MDRKTISLSLEDIEDLITAIDDSLDTVDGAEDDDEIADYIERLEWLRMRLQGVQSATA